MISSPTCFEPIKRHVKSLCLTGNQEWLFQPERDRNTYTFYQSYLRAACFISNQASCLPPSPNLKRNIRGNESVLGCITISNAYGTSRLVKTTFPHSPSGILCKSFSDQSILRRHIYRSLLLCLSNNVNSSLKNYT